MKITPREFSVLSQVSKYALSIVAAITLGHKTRRTLVKAVGLKYPTLSGILTKMVKHGILKVNKKRVFSIRNINDWRIKDEIYEPIGLENIPPGLRTVSVRVVTDDAEKQKFHLAVTAVTKLWKKLLNTEVSPDCIELLVSIVKEEYTIEDILFGVRRYSSVIKNKDLNFKSNIPIVTLHEFLINRLGMAKLRSFVEWEIYGSSYYRYPSNIRQHIFDVAMEIKAKLNSKNRESVEALLKEKRHAQWVRWYYGNDIVDRALSLLEGDRV